MGRTVGKVASLALALMLLAALVVGAWFLVVRLASWLTSLKSDLAVAIVAASVAGLVSILSLVISKWYETRAANLQDLRAKKTPVYEGIVGTLFRVMFAEQLGEKQMDEKELLRWFAETTEKLSIWGSNDLIKAFGEFKQVAADDEGTQPLFTLEKLVFAIRKDLGHDGALEKGSILRLFVNDIDEHL